MKQDLLTINLSHTRHGAIGDFLFRVAYQGEKLKQLRKENRVWGYSHNGGEHSLRIDCTKDEFKTIYKEWINTVVSIGKPLTNKQKSENMINKYIPNKPLHIDNYIPNPSFEQKKDTLQKKFPGVLEIIEKRIEQLKDGTIDELKNFWEV